MKEKTGGFDYFRLAAALLVVAIHTSPLMSIHEDADDILVQIFARIAVPFFIMVTGYFLLSEYLEGRNQRIHFGKAVSAPKEGRDGIENEIGIRSEGRSLSRIWRALRKLLLLYGCAVLLYLPVNWYSGKLDGYTALDYLGCLIFPFGSNGSYRIMQSLIFRGTFYHLWYFPGIIIGILLVVLLAHRLPYSVVSVVSILLYVIGLLGDNYYGFIPKTGRWSTIYEAIFYVCGNTRNGFFFVPVFLVMGAGIGMAQRMQMNRERQAGHGRTLKARYGNTIYLGLFLIMYACMLIEGILIKNYDLGNGYKCMYIFLIPCMFFLFQFLKLLPVRPRPVLRSIATIIYIIHPICILLVRGAAKILHMEDYLVSQSLIHYLAVCVLSMIGAWIWNLAWRKLQQIMKRRGREWQEKLHIPSDQPIQTDEIIDLNLVPQRVAASDSGGEIPDHTDSTGRAWIEISRENLQHNVHVLQNMLPPGSELMPAVKANAYGHGAVEIARELNALGIHAFCVASVTEGVELRQAGIQGDILILGYTELEQIPMVDQYGLIQTVTDRDYAEVINTYGYPLRVHIKVDTGMHRLGERCDHIEDLCQIFACENLQVVGIYTHLCCAESEDRRDVEYTRQQHHLFEQVVQELIERGYDVGKTHILASSGLLHVPEYGGDYVRVGIAMYGVCSDREEAARCGGNLYPVMSIRARVEMVKPLYAGESAGYDLQYTARSDRQLAILSIGYADGIPRSLSCGVGKVLIHGAEAQIVGRICMDQMLVDVTNIPDVESGDIATILGKSGTYEITAYDLSEEAVTITNEILSRMGSRLGRIVV